MNTSATGGYLQPVTQEAPGGIATEDTLQAAIVGITGLPSEMVRPRWQAEAPRGPENIVNWCAFGITDYVGADYPVLIHHSGSEGNDELVRHEYITVTVSMYGPDAGATAALLRDGLYIPQNREGLRLSGIAFVGAGNLLHVPEVSGAGWRARVDMPLNFCREIRRTYAVQNIIKSTGTIEADVSDLIVGIGCQGE